MPSAPPHEPRFGLLDAMGSDRDDPNERPLADVSRASIPGIERIAEDVVTLLETERSGLPKEQEARLQNRVLRTSIQRRVDPGDIRSRILTQIGSVHGDEVAHRASEMLQDIEVGIHGTLAAIETLRANFQREHIEDPDARQLIATNDTLDAKRKIDLIEVRYTPGIPVTIDEIRFVQSKARTAPSAAEQKAIIDAHRGYYGEMLTMQEIEQHERLRDAEQIVAQQYVQLHEASESNDDDRQLELAIALRGDALARMFQAPPPLTETTIMRGAQRENIPLAWLNLFLRHPDAKPFLAHLANLFASSPSTLKEIRQSVSALRAWAIAREPSSGDLSALDPAWHLSERFRNASSFTSITLVGGTITARQRIDKSGTPPKVLTVKE